MKQKVEEDTQTMIYSMSLQVLLEEYVLFAELSEIEISGMCCDSRKVQHGDLFLAYPGESGADGRDYIQQAIKNGASAVLSEPLNSQDAITMMNCREVENNIGVPVIPIHDLRNKSGLLATKFYGYPSRQMQMIGVTGTNGKTSISYLIGKICQGLKISTPIIGTFGSGFTSNSLQAHGLTTPDCISLQKELTKFRDQGAEMVAMEVSSHAISQQRVKGIHYDVKVFTNCSRDHLDYHGSMQEYINAKKQFFSDKDFNYMVVNLDDPVGLELAQVYNESVKVIGISKKTIPLSCHKNMVIAGVASSINGLTIKFDGDWGAGIINSQLIGDFNAFNLIAAITTLLCSGVSMTSILSVVNKIAHIPGRMEYYGGGSLPTVVVDYAHTPDALSSVLQALRKCCRKRLWCVFGCGGDRDRGKRKLMGEIAERYSDWVILTNDNPRNEDPQSILDDILSGMVCPWAAEQETNRVTAIANAIKQAEAGDIVLIAGKGHEREQIIGEKSIVCQDAHSVQLHISLKNEVA